MATLEERVAAIEERLGMESGLRASMDEDLTSLNAKLTAANHLVQALAITQGEHTTELERVRRTQGEHTVALSRIIEMLGTLIDRENGDS